MPLIAPPLSIYVHLPWCVRKCPYCDFNSHAAPPDLPQARYIDCLLEDLRCDSSWSDGREVQSIFFGGGTPSLFAPEQIDRFLCGVRRCVALAADVEVTMEANPGTIEHGRFAGYRAAGVTRVSLGVQSFDDAQLQRLGRIHSCAQIEQAVTELRTAGFDNFNLDLMYGLPQQSVAEALRDLKDALALRPTHISHYQLTLEPGTVFYHRPPPLPDEDTTWAMQTQCQAMLADNGYRQYEVSAYALPDRQCRHNLNYWQFGDYLGLGAGAHGKWTDAKAGRIWRTVRCKQPRDYLQTESGARIAERTVIPASELSFEFMLNALRLRAGFTVAHFRSTTGLEEEALMPTLVEARQRKLLMETQPGTWKPTELGSRFLNDLQSLFLAN